MRNETLIEFITEALAFTKTLDGVAAFSDLPLGVSWSLTFRKNRQSTLLFKSNFDTVTADISQRFPRDAKVIHVPYAAGGYTKHLVVRFVDENGQPTPAATAIFEWVTNLDEYPVADEIDFQSRERAIAVHDLEYYIDGMVTENAPPDWAEQIVARMEYVTVLDDNSLLFPIDPTSLAKEMRFLTEAGE